MAKDVINVSIIIPTINRSIILERTLESIFEQSCLAAEIIVVDASDVIKDVERQQIPHGVAFKYIKAEKKGAAAQRNQGIEIAKQPFIFFMDDDILLEAFCIERIWECMNSDTEIGGVSAMITNQQYTQPGKFTRLMYRLMAGESLLSYAGKCIGPAWNILPEDKEDLPPNVVVEWLNTGCTLYRREALPSPVFDDFFTGYSLMEDLALSLSVGKSWKLMNARTARIFHDSQPGEHKNNLFQLSKMDFRNRYYVMTSVLNRKKASDYLKFFGFQIFQIIAAGANSSQRRHLLSMINGKISGLLSLIRKN